MSIFAELTSFKKIDDGVVITLSNGNEYVGHLIQIVEHQIGRSTVMISVPHDQTEIINSKNDTLDTFIENMKLITKKLSGSKEDALNFLVKVGICNEDGSLNNNYK